MSEGNGEAKKIRLITEPGAFGVEGLMIIIRRWLPKEEQTEKKKITVESYTLVDGTADAQLEEARRKKQEVIVEPAFCSFTILKFVEETRRLAEPEPEKPEGPNIIRPNFRDTKRFNRSKFMPDGT